jgi:redox-regulated HSP33 family molecular chaperone
MKKIIVMMLSVMLVFTLVACGGSENTVVGTYGIESMTQADTTFTADELAANGVDISDFTLEIRDNGEFTMTVLTGTGSQEVNGTWEADGDKITMSADGQPAVDATLNGNLLTVSQDGTELVFEKV